MWVNGREGFLGAVAVADDGARESEERSGVHDVRRISSSAASRAPVLCVGKLHWRVLLSSQRGWGPSRDAGCLCTQAGHA